MLILLVHLRQPFIGINLLNLTKTDENIRKQERKVKQ